MTSAKSAFGRSSPEIVVEKESGAQHPLGPQMRFMRQHKLQRLDQMWRNAKQDFTLSQSFADKAEFVMFEVAQTAVNELGRPLRSVRSEVVFFDEQHRQAAPNSIACNACAVDSAADNENINGLCGRL